MELYEVLRRPLITEKNTMLGAQSKFTFEVAKDANKIQIRQAVEAMFNVDVTAVNTINVKGKMRRVRKSRGMTRSWKKAVVTLKPGQRIDLFGGP